MMSGKFTAYLIEPTFGTIRYVSIDRGLGKQSIKSLIGCTMMDAVHLGKRHLAYCDDNGFGDGLRSVCELVGYPRPFAGNLLVAGLDGEGELTAPHQTISAIADLFAIVRPVFDPLLREDNAPDLSGTTRLNVRIERRTRVIMTS
ncbi:DUF3846 domain-containing protein [Agrobacterium tumefaciens]|uniref:DUF3846 domain-containing protein n=1 Tax=Agrobacterium tumefaciens TaxID=358 RepID=A0AB36EJ00_AGRTU|nr:hypothetical protein A6U91_21165 [Agrobacterium tumefaciens]